MTNKVLVSLVLAASMIAASGASAQQKKCDSTQATPQTNDDCTVLGGLWGAGAGVGIAIAVGTAAVIAGAAGGGGGGGETPNTLPGS